MRKTLQTGQHFNYERAHAGLLTALVARGADGALQFHECAIEPRDDRFTHIRRTVTYRSFFPEYAEVPEYVRLSTWLNEVLISGPVYLVQMVQHPSKSLGESGVFFMYALDILGHSDSLLVSPKERTTDEVTVCVLRLTPVDPSDECWPIVTEFAEVVRALHYQASALGGYANFARMGEGEDSGVEAALYDEASRGYIRGLSRRLEEVSAPRSTEV